MKNKKLKLHDLKVKSFVTEESQIDNETIKGGRINPSIFDGCFSTPIQCDIVSVKCTPTTTRQTFLRCSFLDNCQSALGCSFVLC